MTSTLIHSAGASSGYLVSPFSLTSTAMLSGAANAGYFLSTASFNQTNTGNAQNGYIWIVTNSTSPQQTAGGNLAGWFMLADASGAFEVESTVAGTSRPPDFIIPFPSTSTTIVAAGNYFSIPSPVPLPWQNFKVFVQNNAGLTLGTTFAQLFCGPVADDIV
jgi:hypothetical protein